MSQKKPAIGIIMGSRSDWPTLKAAAAVLDKLKVQYETKIVSAHRTPKRLYDYATTAKGRGLKVIIAGAGGAAHLPGMAASMTTLPVLGVPVETMAIGKAGAINAALLAASIVGLSNQQVAAALEAYRAQQTDAVEHEP